MAGTNDLAGRDVVAAYVVTAIRAFHVVCLSSYFSLKEIEQSVPPNANSSSTGSLSSGTVSDSTKN